MQEYDVERGRIVLVGWEDLGGCVLIGATWHDDSWPIALSVFSCSFRAEANGQWMVRKHGPKMGKRQNASHMKLALRYVRAKWEVVMSGKGCESNCRGVSICKITGSSFTPFMKCGRCKMFFFWGTNLKIDTPLFSYILYTPLKTVNFEGVKN